MGVADRHNTGSRLLDRMCHRSEQGGRPDGGSEKLGHSPRHQLKQSQDLQDPLGLARSDLSDRESWTDRLPLLISGI